MRDVQIIEPDTSTPLISPQMAPPISYLDHQMLTIQNTCLFDNKSTRPLRRAHSLRPRRPRRPMSAGGESEVADEVSKSWGRKKGIGSGVASKKRKKRRYGGSDLLIAKPRLLFRSGRSNCWLMQRSSDGKRATTCGFGSKETLLWRNLLESRRPCGG